MKGRSKSKEFPSAPVQQAFGSIDEIFASNGPDRLLCDRDDVVLPRGAQLQLRGWAGNAKRDAPTQSMQTTLDGASIPNRYGHPRGDVATHYDRKGLTDIGLHVVIETADLALGAHEIRLSTRDGDVLRAFAPVRFRLIEPDEARAKLRVPTRGLFDVELHAFHGINEPVSTDARIQKRFIGVVRGSLRECRNGSPPKAVVATIDGFERRTGQLAYRFENASHGSNEFLICFASVGLSLGPHRLQITAIAQSDDLERVVDRDFHVVPISCGTTVPLSQPQIAIASIDWVHEKPRYTRDDIAGVRGWAIDPIDGEAAGEAYLRFDDGRTIALFTRQYRNDVRLDRAAKTEFCGFVGTISFAHFAVGHHRARVFVESKDQTRSHATDAFLAFEVVGP